MQLTEIFIGGGFLLLIVVLVGVIGYLYVGQFKIISSVARWKNLVWGQPYSPNHGAVKQEKHKEVYKQNNRHAPLVFILAIMASILYAIYGATWKFEILKNGVEATAYFKEDYSGKWANYSFYAPQTNQNVEIKERVRLGRVDGEVNYKKPFPVRYNPENPKKYLRSHDLLKKEWTDFYVGLQFVGLLMVGLTMAVYYAITSKKSQKEILRK